MDFVCRLLFCEVYVTLVVIQDGFCLSTFRKRIQLFEEEFGFMIRRRRVQKQSKQKHKFGIRQILKERERRGAFNTLYRELHSDHEYFFRYLRISPGRFRHFSIVEN